MEIIIIVFIILVLLSLIYYIYAQEPTNDNNKIKEVQDLLENVEINRRIVVSLTTSPERIKYIDEILKNIEEQTVKPDVIYLNIPYYFKRTCEKYDETKLEEIKKNHPLVIINRLEDVGPITKLIGGLDKEINPSTLFIIIDDDEKYENVLIEKLVKQFLLNPKVALCNDVNKYAPVKNVDIPGVYAGFIFSRDMIKDNIYDFIKSTNLYKHCYNSDDLIIGLYFKSQDIKIQQPVIITDNNELEYGNSNDALKKQDQMYHNNRYILCKKYVHTML